MSAIYSENACDQRVSAEEFHAVRSRRFLHVLADRVGNLVAIARDRVELTGGENASCGELHVFVAALFVGSDIVRRASASTTRE